MYSLGREGRSRQGWTMLRRCALPFSPMLNHHTHRILITFLPLISLHELGDDALLRLWDSSMPSLPPSNYAHQPSILPSNPSTPSSSLPISRSTSASSEKTALVSSRTEPRSVFEAPTEIDNISCGLGGDWVACVGGGTSYGGRGWLRSVKT